MSEARILADVLFSKDPNKVKYWHRVWGSEAISRWGRVVGSTHVVIDHRPEFMSLEDQLEEAANQLTRLGRFRFLCRPATSDGAVSNDVFPLSIAEIDRDAVTGDYHYPDLPRISEVRSLLAAQSGVPMQTLLAEQDALLPKTQALRQSKTLGTPPASQQSSVEKTPTAHPPLPPRRHQISNRTG
jgi:hypothetical protein